MAQTYIPPGLVEEQITGNAVINAAGIPIVLRETRKYDLPLEAVDSFLGLISKENNAGRVIKYGDSRLISISGARVLFQGGEASFFGGQQAVGRAITRVDKLVKLSGGEDGK